MHLLYKSMKAYKAKEKQRFYQAAQKDELKFSNLSKYPLFCTIKRDAKYKSDKEVFDEFIRLGKQITNISNEINYLKKSKNTIEAKNKSKEKEKLCRERGMFLTKLKGNKTYFSNYVCFCELFKQVAMSHGKLKAQVKGIQNEEIEFKRLQYWATIGHNTSNGKYMLILFPKMIMGSNDEPCSKPKMIMRSNDEPCSKLAYEYITKASDAKQSSLELIYFESLTHRALEKLCFSGINEGTNTFWEPVTKESPTITRYFVDQQRHDPYNFANDNDKVCFYKKVLATEAAQNSLKGIDFERLKNTVIKQSFDDFDAFRSALEGNTYIRHIKFSEHGLKELQKQYSAQIFEITSRDIARNPKCSSNLKEHTQIWKDFWEKESSATGYKTRLNPEINILWREARSKRVKKYKDPSRYDERKFKQNRYLHDQFTLLTTFSENATNKTIEASFKDTKNVAEQIQKFNELFLKDQIKNNEQYQYAIGIDVGTVDLATIALFKRKGFLPKNEVSTSNKSDLKVSDLTKMDGSTEAFKVYKIKDLKYKKTYHFKENTEDNKERKTEENTKKTKNRFVIDNPSFFVSKQQYEYAFPSDDNNNDYEKDFKNIFEEYETCSLDLTTAKLFDRNINKKSSEKIIVVNGDIKTYLKLKERNARRKMLQIREIHPNAKLIINEQIYFRYNDPVCDDKCVCKTPVYYLNRKYDIETPKAIKEKLAKYLQRDDANILIEESKINHLREAIVANMVGILSYLYQKYPCIIALENLEKDIIESHRDQFAGSITRFLEYALYRKFQKANLIPPKIKDIVKIREDIRVNAIEGTKITREDHLRQFGIVFFVDEKGTGWHCPKCKKNNPPDPSPSDPKIDLRVVRKKEGYFKCTNDNCDFDTRNTTGEFKCIDDQDKVAAFNIAKLGYASYARLLAQLKQANKATK